MKIGEQSYCCHLLIQASAALVFMWLVLIGLDAIAASKIIWAAGASSLASSTYIVFCTPKAVSAKPQKIMGGYLIAMFCGEGIRLLANLSEHSSIHIFEIAAAVSLGLAFLLMVLLKAEHPPAAGLAVVMVLDIRNLMALGIILFAVIILLLIRIIFRHQLCDLI